MARDEVAQILSTYGQGLSEKQRTSFEDQLSRLDFAELARLYSQSKSEESSLDLRSVSTPPVIRLNDVKRHNEARAISEKALRAGQLAVILVAGGQGTRLGHDAPKGTYPIGPVTQRSLFQIHAEKVLALSRRYGTNIPLLIMTSQENDAVTRDYFHEHRWFGLDASQVWFFLQGMLPALNAATGEVLLRSPGELALGPNGHGGVIQALHEAGYLDRLQAQGVTDCYYFQVDNPLVKIGDPTFVGHHLAAKAEMSLKVLAKLYPMERMGNLVELEGRCRIIEYTELPQQLAEERMPSGELRIWAGSPAIHLFQLKFLQRLGRGEISLPYHIARKAVPYVNQQGEVVKPTSPNALKFERFVFDALPLAERVVAVETSREKEFEPLKNADGENSPQSVRQALSNLYAQWLRAAGIDIPTANDGQSKQMLEISPLTALDADDLKNVPSLDGKWLSQSS